jgi:hypothetical protein
LLFEVRGLETDKYKDAKVGCLIHCEGGHVLVPDYNSAIAYDNDGKEVAKFAGSDNHFANFIKAVRSRKKEDLHADVQEGHLSSALCHTGNISYRLGQQMDPEELQAGVKDNHEMSETLGRLQDHLTANKVDLKTSKLTLGAALTLDPATEQFIGNASANKMLKREYRAPFIVPEQV